MPSLTSGKNAADARRAMVKDVRAKLGNTEVLFKGSFKLSVKTGEGKNSSEDSNDEGEDSNDGNTSIEQEGSKVGEELPAGFELVEGFKDLWVRRLGHSADASRPARRTPSPEKGMPPVPSIPSPSRAVQPSTVLPQPTTPARLVFLAARRTPVESAA
ncbi:hypothetical protein PQX77_018509 [Marasmius sp. AFHP31]|nr:hypothetical protein PQX77_018509 [Marasmius sp. AFHP31]